MTDKRKPWTPGPWKEREDYDYYQGGTYLYVGDEKDYTDICRVEDEDSKALLKAAPAMGDLLERIYQDATENWEEKPAWYDEACRLLRQIEKGE